MGKKKKKILITEDEKSMARVLELKLKSSGFDVSVAHDGEEALSELHKGGYDLILLDLIMPKKDGFEVLSELQKADKKIPTIVSTNLSQQDDERRAKELGAIDYFVKSDTPIREVVERVKRALGQ